MKAERIKTENGNYIIKVEYQAYNYVFYVNNENMLIKHSTIDEWEWACQEWDEINYVIPLCEKLKSIVADKIRIHDEYQDKIKNGINLSLKEIGINELWILRNDIDNFVSENFDILWEGACRFVSENSQDVYICEEDYYAPARIQVNNTRLHAQISLKYADGHKYDSDFSPTEEQIINTVRDLQMLIDKASEDIKTNLKIKITNND